MKHYARVLGLLALLCSAAVGSAQETWNLERAIRHAQENNLTVRQARATVRTALLREVLGVVSTFVPRSLIMPKVIVDQVRT